MLDERVALELVAELVRDQAVLAKGVVDLVGHCYQRPSYVFNSAQRTLLAGDLELLSDLLHVASSDDSHGGDGSQLLERGVHLWLGGQSSEREGTVDVEHADGLGQLSLSEGLDALGEDIDGGGSGHVGEAVGGWKERELRVMSTEAKGAC